MRRKSTTRRVMHICIGVATAVVGGVTAGGVDGVASAGATGPCPIVSVRTALPSSGPAGWAENLAFDGTSSLWVSRLNENAVERYDDRGRRTARVAVNAPGAVRLGPDGLLYIASGDAVVNMLPGAPRTGTIVRIDPDRVAPAPRIVARGLGMPNGLTFDSAGRLYVADGNLGVLRIGPTGAVDERWSAHAPKNLAPSRVANGTGINGIMAVDGDLFVTLTVSGTGRVLRVPIAAPGATSVAADITRPLPGVLDDLASLDRRTLAVTTPTGQLAFVDLVTGSVCSTTVGQPVTAVAVRPGRGEQLMLSAESGEILAVTVRR